MRAAQARTREPGVAPHAQEFSQQEVENGARARLYHFLVPLLLLLGVSLYADLDVQVGTIVAVAMTILLFGLQRLMSWTEMFDGVLEGIKIMVPALTIVIVAFMFKEVNDRLGLAPYVIESVLPYMSAALLPLVVFVTMSLISFATGSSWGVFAIAIPIVLPLADAVGVSPPLAIGALMSASAFGSHACFYSDSTVLAAQGAGCGVMSHALTQFPYALIAALLSGVALTLLAGI
jgi:Na+/H+ antiporter NhaC